MGILGTAASLYAENKGMGMLSSVGQATKQHFKAATHPTNVVGKLMGFGSFAHSLATRTLGEPEYTPGGAKNVAKSGVKSRKKPKVGPTPKNGAGGKSSTSGSENKQLDRIDDNTRETVDVLKEMRDGDKDAADKADRAADFDEEKTAEQNRLFASFGDKIAKLSISPAGAASGINGGKDTSGGGGFGFMDLAGIGLAAALGPMILSFIGSVLSSVSIVGMGLAVANGLIAGFESYMAGGDFQTVAAATISGLTFGILSPDWIKTNVAAPLEAVFTNFFSIVDWAIDSAWTKIKNFFDTSDLAKYSGQTPGVPGDAAYFNPAGAKRAAEGEQLLSGFRKMAQPTIDPFPTMKPMAPGYAPVSTSTAGAGLQSPASRVMDSIMGSKPPAAGAAPQLSPGSKFFVGGAGGGLMGASEKTTGAAIVKGLIDRGFTQDEAIAIAGNMGHESSGFKAGINEAKPLVPGSRGGYGLMQWTGPRRRQLEAFAAARGKPVSDVDLQLDFTAHELRGKEAANFERAMAGSTLAQKTVGFSREVLRPGIPHETARIQYANKVAAEIGGSPTVAPSSAPSPAKLDVFTPTLATASMASQVSAAREETALTAATVPAAGDVNNNTVINNSTAASGIPQALPESIDDLVTKVLIAMGAISQT